ncbi:DUF6624 domain-containing protein [Niabella aurantiaca]|uniref:DUF6624 domain-containing protein n=1 Tax=Niabella aurantiaca TaxID=379900 RepID=UPI000362C4A5|nr:DUF6624 domain-containing protein [Niabella aurantiaca]
MRLLWTLLFFSFHRAILSQERIPYNLLSSELEEILAKDQGPRDTLNKLVLQYGARADTIGAYWSYIHAVDSLNMRQVSGIINVYGWPDNRRISPDASKALWLVIQHADSLTREEYLPVLEQAVAEKKAPKKYYAYLYDRVQMFRERFQLYGTQLGGDYEGNTVLWPVKDMIRLDARRKAMGLPPIKEALKDYSVSWSDPAYDSLAGRIVFYGLVSNRQGSGIAGIHIYEPSGKFAGKTGQRGYFRVLANRRALRKGLLFKGVGYRAFRYHFRNQQAEVFYDTISLPEN